MVSGWEIVVGWVGDRSGWVIVVRWVGDNEMEREFLEVVD